MINNHSKLVNELLLMIGKEFPNIRVWKNATGATKVENRVIKFGLKGSADILGIVKPSGKLLAIECKTGQAVQSNHQKNFENMILNFGGIYLVTHDTQGVRQFLANICLQ
jgi:hypothetical protein